MKLAVVGSRHYNDYEAFSKTMDEAVKFWHSHGGNPLSLVSGGAHGADSMAERYATEHSIEIVVFQAEWDRYGKAAGPIRNGLIVNEADAMIAFLAPKSRGTKNSIDQAKKKGIPLRIIRIGGDRGETAAGNKPIGGSGVSKDHDPRGRPADSTNQAPEARRRSLSSVAGQRLPVAVSLRSDAERALKEAGFDQDQIDYALRKMNNALGDENEEHLRSP